MAAAIGSDPYTDLQPPGLWRHFAALSGIPRRSGHEDAAREYVHEVAKSVGADFVVDGSGNALVRATGRRRESSPSPVAVQSHLDMVCVAAPGVEHDFDRDPVVVDREGDRIFARGTTLGADNGIGVAAALALLTEPDIAPGPLELLFTIEEEVGLVGALNFDPSQLQARSLINLDSENDRALTVGCAGGAEVALRLELASEDTGAGWSRCELRISGLSGGHSGMQIHECRANAIKLAAELLAKALAAGVDLRLISIDAGLAHNAIPTEAHVSFAVRAGESDLLESTFDTSRVELERQWGEVEPRIALDLLAGPGPYSGPAAEPSDTARLVGVLRDLPHGVLAMSPSFPGTVATSANLAKTRMGDGVAEVLVSVRALTAEDLDGVVDGVRQIGDEASAEIEAMGGYPSWEPREDSPLVAATAAAYERINNRPPAIEVIHGGLECGVLVASRPDLDAVSFGPLIREAHTPDEHVFASTVTKAWSLLLELV